MKRFLRWSLAAAALALALACLAALALGAALYLAVEPEARISRQADITPAHVERAVQLFLRHDPRQLRPGAQDQLSLRQDDLDVALNYFALRFARTSTQLVLGEGTAWLRASTRLPPNPLGQALNLEMALSATATLPHVDRLRIGRLTVPASAANLLLGLGFGQLRELSPGAAKAIDSIDRVSLRSGALDLAYTWRGKAPGQAGLRFWSAAEQARIDSYLALLASQSVQWRPLAKDRAMPLAALVRPLLQSAALHSLDETSAVAENRAALVALAQFVNARETHALLANPPLAGELDGTPPITLNGRTDTAQHFTVSAALTAMAGSPLSDAVGLYKELSDAQGGSGFSFNDLAADRAGTRFGSMATASTASARQFQHRFAEGLPALVLLPPVADLPESMQLAEFNRRFGGVEGSAARSLRNDIERRLAALPVYR